MQDNEIHRQPSAFVFVLASLLLPASGHCNDLKNYWHPCSFAKEEGGTVADDDNTLGSSSYISQSASIVIEDNKRSQKLTSICLPYGKSLFVCSFCSFFGCALVAVAI